jgi:hypothetical protein
MNVPQRHCVPTSFCPVGPNGLAQIQNCLPQFAPGFFVVRLLHGSPWPSHRGSGFFENSFVHPSREVSGSTKDSEFADGEAMGGGDTFFVLRVADDGDAGGGGCVWVIEA